MRRQLEAVVEARIADGYASDDEEKPRPLPRGYGALQGDLPPRRPRLSQQEQREYQIRQASSGPSSSKVRYLDAVLGLHDPALAAAAAKRQRFGFAETRLPRAAFEKHCKLLSWLPSKQKAIPAKTDLQLLHEAHRFLRSDEDDDGSWESKLEHKFYTSLFKDYVICDLSGYKKCQVVFRWRTEAEVIQGRGQFQCGHKHCISKSGLRSFEVDFKYREAGTSKRAMVKVRVCDDCAYKLHYRRLKRERRRLRKGKRRCAEECGADTVHVDSENGDIDGSDAEADEHVASPSKGEDGPSNADLQQLEALAWKGPDPNARTREDDFDDYFNDLFC
jgi:protein FRA10AC1